MITPGRVLGALAMAAAVYAGNWLMTDPQFALDPERVHIAGLVHSDEAAVRQRLGLPPGASPNVFELRTAAMVRALVELPAVDRADASVVLPDGLAVAVTERVPVFAWQVGGEYFLVDATGVLVVEVDEGAALASGLPIVDDRRPAAESPVPGTAMDEIDLAAILKLAAVTPAVLASEAGHLGLSVDDQEGFVLAAEPMGWRAVFGHYTATLRTTDMIDGQVQCLRSILAEGEAGIEAVFLSLGDDRCGTFMPRETPRGRPAASASPGRGQPSPTADD